MRPAVSIILPYRDAAAFLSEAIASVEGQSSSSWQLILVDDHSTDGGPALAKAAAGRDHRIQALHLPNGKTGAAVARNFGLRHANGDHVAFLDADDRFFPNKLETELALMERFPGIGMTWGPTLWWYPGHPHRNWLDRPLGLAGRVHAPPSLLIDAVLLQRTHVPSMLGIMVRRSAIPEGSAFEPKLALYEDQSLVAKILAHWPVYVGSHRTGLYRQHVGSTSARAETDGAYGRLGAHPARSHFLDWMRAYLSKEPGIERQCARALLIAQAIQSGDHSKLDPAERREMALHKLRHQAMRPFTRTYAWLKRRILQLRYWRRKNSDPLGFPL